MENWNIRGILTVSGGYIAAVIGAGFASGQEIVSFFVRFGRYGAVGIAVACVLFAVFSCAVLCRCVESRIHSYSAFLGHIFRGKWLRFAAEGVVLLCAAASLCVMMAGAGEIGVIFTGVSASSGAAALAALCGVIFLMDARRIMGLNSFLGGIIIIGIIFSCFYIMRYREHQVFSPYTQAAVSGLSYAGYNLAGTGAVLAGMSRFLKSRSEAVISSVVSGTVLFIMIMLIWGVLCIYYGQINLGEIPMLTMTFRQSRALGIFYGLMLSAAVLTTAVSSGFAATDILRRITSRRKAVLFTLFTAFCMSGAGFSSLIGGVYRICGYAGAALSVLIIVKAVKIKKNGDKQRKIK